MSFYYASRTNDSFGDCSNLAHVSSSLSSERVFCVFYSCIERNVLPENFQAILHRFVLKGSMKKRPPEFTTFLSGNEFSIRIIHYKNTRYSTGLPTANGEWQLTNMVKTTSLLSVAVGGQPSEPSSVAWVSRQEVTMYTYKVNEGPCITLLLMLFGSWWRLYLKFVISSYVTMKDNSSLRILYTN